MAGVISVLNLETRSFDDHVVRKGAIMTKVESSVDGSILVASVSGKELRAWHMPSFEPLWSVPIPKEISHIQIYQSEVLVSVIGGHVTSFTAEPKGESSTLSTPQDSS
jgi:hypothetical protein